MAISIKIGDFAENSFCDSKWLGSPDLAPDVEYPMIEAREDGEVFDYPLTLILQINCEDIAALDTEDLLPHGGLLYFYAAIEEARGYESPVHLLPGEIRKGQYLVKYSKNFNMETFETNSFTDEDDKPFAAPARSLKFTHGGEGDFRMLERRDGGEIVLLSVGEEAGLHFAEASKLEFVAKESDLRFGNWKKIKAFLVD